MQAYNGGLVSIDNGGKGNVSVVGSTLTNITVRALLTTLSRTRAPRLPSGGSAPLMRRAVPHGVGCEYPQYPTGVTASVLRVLAAQWSTAGEPLGGRRRELCAACGVQAGNCVGLVSNSGGNGSNVSVVGSTLVSISVRAQCRGPS